LTEEKSALLAVRRVWASLWNERAFDDREYYGIDHSKVFMGVAVHPTFVGERLEAVVLTGLEPESRLRAGP
jgi:pyruvate, water dikinase